MIKYILLACMVFVFGCQTDAVIPKVTRAAKGVPLNATKKMLDVKELREIWRAIKSSPNGIKNFKDSLVRVQSDSCGSIGYRINANGERKLFDKIGIEDRDIIWLVNGFEAPNIARLQRFAEGVLSGTFKNISLELERMDRIMDIHYTFVPASDYEPTEIWVERYDKDPINPPYQTIRFENGDEATLVSLLQRIEPDIRVSKGMVIQIKSMEDKTADITNINLGDIYHEKGALPDVPLYTGLIKVSVYSTPPLPLPLNDKSDQAD